MTVTAGNTKDGRPQKRCPEFLCHVKFKNTLPEPMIDFRLAVDDKVDWSHFTAYRLNALERNHNPPVPVNVLQLSLLNTVDLAQWRTEKGANTQLDPIDRELFLEETDTTTRKSYTSINIPDQTTLETNALTLEKPVTTRKGKRKDEQVTSIEQLLQTIEESFDPPSTLVHPTKKGVYPHSVLPIFPAFKDETCDTLALCSFDTNPIPPNETVDGIKLAKDGDNHALMQGMSNADNPQDSFVWFYMPQATLDDQSPRMIFTREYDIQQTDRAGAMASTSSTAPALLSSSNYLLLHLPENDKELSMVKYSTIQGNFALKRRRTLASKDNHSLIIKRF